MHKVERVPERLKASRQVAAIPCLPLFNCAPSKNQVEEGGIFESNGTRYKFLLSQSDRVCS